MSAGESPARWWHGRRGEWYVVTQGVLFALVLFGPRTLPGAPPWPSAWAGAAQVFGAALALAGTLLAAAAVLRLGRNLTPLPHPKADGELVVSGPYAWARHPIYGGVILLAFGWALWVQGTLTLLWALVLTVFFDVKSRREELWLIARFPAYADYRRRVCKLLPFIY